LPKWGQREEGEEEKIKMGAHGQRSKRRWEDGRTYSGPIFCRRPEGTEKIKVRMRGLMVLKSGGAGALATAHSTLPRVWREAGDEGEVKVMTHIRA